MNILIVDDENSVLRLMTTIIQSGGYEVLQADGGDEALAICETPGTSIDLLISDVAMPKMNGSALAACMNERHPGVPILFVSGYPESREIGAGLTARGFRNGYTYLQKPFGPQALLKAVQLALRTTPEGKRIKATAHT